MPRVPAPSPLRVPADPLRGLDPNLIAIAEAEVLRQQAAATRPPKDQPK